jgi:hypothetical protein
LRFIFQIKKIQAIRKFIISKLCYRKRPNNSLINWRIIKMIPRCQNLPKSNLIRWSSSVKQFLIRDNFRIMSSPELRFFPLIQFWCLLKKEFTQNATRNQNTWINYVCNLKKKSNLRQKMVLWLLILIWIFCLLAVILAINI